MVGKYVSLPPVPRGNERSGVIDTPPRKRVDEGGPLKGVAGMEMGVWKAVCEWNGVIGIAEGGARAGVRKGSLSTFMSTS
jgi:hypothetical protein